MIKEINFRGLSAVPSGYDSPDGDLALSINAINEDGNLKPMVAPSFIRNIAPNTPLCIHKVAGGIVNVIAFNSDDNKLSFSSLREASATFTEIDSWTGQTPTVAVIGNTLIFSDGLDTLYALWDAQLSKYRSLGQAIPEIQASFALSHEARGADSRTETVKVTLPEGYSAQSALQYLGAGSIGRPTVPARSGSEMFVLSLSNAVMGALNKFLVEASSVNRFVQPLMLRWALRLFDGSYVHHSAPVLMVPNSAAPVIMYGEPSTADGAISLPLTIIGRECSLMFRLSGLSQLLKWKDIVRSVDVFVSAPVYTYDQSGSIGSFHRNTDYDIFSVSGVPVEINGSSSGESSGHSPRTRSVETALKDGTLYSFPDGNTEQYLTLSGQHFINPSRFSRQHIEKDICDVSDFYLVSSVPLFGDGELSGDMEGFAYLELDDSSLTNLVTRPRLDDDYRSHETTYFTHAFVYNSRTVLSGVSSALFSGFPLLDMGQYKQTSDNVPLNVAVYVKIVRDSFPCWVSCVSGKVFDPRLPRFLYYPDANATEMRVFIWKDGDDSGKFQKYSLPLKPHDFLNGAYWFAGLAREELLGNVQSLSTPLSSQLCAVPIPERSKIFVSEVNNPFYYPLGGRVTVGSGSVIATSAAVRALSQGQFGQFPLYAFTSEGVWALTVSGSGTISAVQPVTRDVCINPDAITQLDSAVVFPTDRGLMLLSGSQTQCISEAVNALDCGFGTMSTYFPSLVPFVASEIPGIVNPEEEPSPLPFLSFIKDCGILFDYTHQRIILYSPVSPLAPVFSLKSKQWGMMHHNLASHFPSYPEALAVTAEGDVVDFASGTDTAGNAVILSRPLKLDAPDIFKTIDTLIARGNFPKQSVSVVLYGSRNLFNWHPVGSSVTPALRNIHGTPYKYFAVAILASLEPSESISGASISFTPRFTNRLR